VTVSNKGRSTSEVIKTLTGASVTIDSYEAVLKIVLVLGKFLDNGYGRNTYFTSGVADILVDSFAPDDTPRRHRAMAAGHISRLLCTYDHTYLHSHPDDTDSILRYCVDAMRKYLAKLQELDIIENQYFKCINDTFPKG